MSDDLVVERAREAFGKAARLISFLKDYEAQSSEIELPWQSAADMLAGIRIEDLCFDAALAAVRDEASRRERERVVGSLVSHFLSSFDSAFWDNRPRPWRVEEDWTCEITAANGRIITKLPYPRDLDIAYEVVAIGNAYEVATEKDAEELLRALADQPQPNTTEGKDG